MSPEIPEVVNNSYFSGSSRLVKDRSEEEGKMRGRWKKPMKNMFS